MHGNKVRWRLLLTTCRLLSPINLIDGDIFSINRHSELFKKKTTLDRELFVAEHNVSVSSDISSNWKHRQKIESERVIKLWDWISEQYAIDGRLQFIVFSGAELIETTW